MSGFEMVFGALAGLVLGLLTTVIGGGGALLTVPLLVYVFEKSPSQAAGTSLVAVLVSALIGVVGHWRAKKIRVPVALSFGLAAMAGAVGGSKLNGALDERATMTIFNVILFAAAARMALGEMPKEGQAEIRGPELFVPAGLFIGVLVGLLGVSGGFLTVPVLVFAGGLALHEAIGTTVAIIVLSASSGAVSHGLMGNIDPKFTALIAGGAALGGVVGGPLAGKLPERPVRWGYTAVMTVAGCYVLYRTWLS